MTLGEKLSKLRKEYNYTQEQLADILGVSRQSISKWESDIAYLQEYVMPTSKERKSTPIPLTTVPKKICFSKKIAGTIYDVTANFDLEGKETILQQFKALILAKEL